MGNPKQALREEIWARMAQPGVAAFPRPHGRIPNFTGSSEAARRLATTPEWQRAATIKCNPDSPQRWVRLLALREGKRVYMAVPRLRAERCFLELDPARLTDVAAAATIGGATQLGRPLDPRQLPHIDLIVAGAVAVDRRGGRLGKGGGYADLEYAIGRSLGCIDDDTRVATTVHPLQIVDAALPMTAHDVWLDLIVTPSDVIRPRRRRAPQPRGVLGDHLTDEQRAAIPILRVLGFA